MLQLDKEWRKAHVNSSLVGKFACKQLVRGKVMSCTKTRFWGEVFSLLKLG